MRAIAGFWGKAEARPTGSVKTAVGAFAQWISTLDDKPGDHTMKRQAIEEFQLDQIQEAFDVARGIVRKKTDFNVPQGRRDHGLRVFLLKLYGR